jgi:hypothetical protein
LFYQIDMYLPYEAQLETDLKFLPIVPMDDNTRAMLAYAASSEGRARIGQARLELQMGKGIPSRPAISMT